jgi:hypothetical protein
MPQPPKRVIVDGHNLALRALNVPALGLNCGVATVWFSEAALY